MHRARCSRTAGPPSPLPADVGIRPRAPVAPMQSIGKRTHRQWCDRSGRPAAPHCRLAMTPPSLHSLSDAARSRRAHSGGPTRRSEIFSARLVGFSSSTHRSHQKPLHVLIGSPLTIYRRRTQTTKWHHQKSAAVGFKYIGTSRAHSFKAHLKSAGLGGLSPAGGKESRSACPIHPLGQFTRAARLPLLVSLCPSI